MEETYKNIDPNIVSEYVDSYAKSVFREDFSFRVNQKESIVAIIISVLKGLSVVEIEAPTGSGKSIICLVSAGVLSRYYSKSSYILCSDVSLFDQYASFIKSHKMDIGCLKGSKGNYMCMRNGRDYSESDCKEEKLSFKTLSNNEEACELGYSCALSCEYILNRKKAIKTNITLMTYQLWLHFMNLVEKKNPDESDFHVRDVVFCDECHKIPSIVSQFCTCEINPSSLFYHLERLKIVIEKRTEYKLDISKIRDSYNLCISLSENQTESSNKALKDSLFQLFDKIKIFLDIYDNKIKKEVLMWIKAKKAKEEDIKGDRAFNELIELYSSFVFLFSAIENSGMQFFVSMTRMQKKSPEKILTLKCAKEDMLCKENLLSNGSNFVMLSATLGNKDAFNENIGTSNYTNNELLYFSLPSTFNFDNSPIYFMPNYKMSYNCINDSMQKILPILEKILDLHKNQRGIIHTSSFKLSRDVIQYFEAKGVSRLLYYEGSIEKRNQLEKYQMDSDKILIGPSLIEGLDFSDDLCRFIIFLKVPYPNISDPLVKTKMKYFPSYYQAEASNSMIQGMGRGIRHENDWCVSYILDGCFSSLYQSQRCYYPSSLINRIKILVPGDDNT